MYLYRKLRGTLGQIWVYLAISSLCYGHDYVVNETTQLPQNVSSVISWYQDPTSKLCFDQVKKLVFKKHTAPRVLLPFAKQNTWLKIKLKNKSKKDSVWYFFMENPVIRKSALFIDGQLDSTIFEPFKITKLSEIRRPYFKVKIRPNEAKTFYFKLESERGIYFVLQLYDATSFEKFYDANKVRVGFNFGLTLMVIFVVFAIGFLMIKDRKSRAYALYSLVRCLGFWAAGNVLGPTISSDALLAEKITFAVMSIHPLISAFLALSILPFDKLPRKIKTTTYGFIVFNVVLLILLLLFYGPVTLKFLVVLTLLSHIFFYGLFIFTFIKRSNEYPYYSIPFLLGNVTNCLLNIRVLGIANINYIIELTILMVILEIGVYVYYLSHIFRISVKKQAEKLKNLGFEAEKAAKLEELDKLKTRFFTNISHEFRTPLTLLVGPIDDLQKKYPQESIITVIQRNLQRLQILINQILDLSKLEAGEMKTHTQLVELTVFLHQLFATFEPLAKTKNINFTYSKLESQQHVLADIDKIEKIITNLLSNAFKFTPEWGKIDVIVNFDQNHLKIIVQDSGIGIASERLPKIFDRFYQVEEHKTYEGTGVGLALVKELVDLLNGQLEVSSIVGHGTNFSLILPLEKQLHHKGQTILFTPKLDVEGPDNIMLIVEDNTDLQNYLVSIFENHYQLILAADGEEGLAKATETVPDVVITDLMMPKLDGLALCQKLKTDERTSHIPLVMLTAKTSLADRVVGLEYGADDYIIKPFNKEELEVRVKNLVNQRQMLRERYARKSEPKEPSIDERFLLKCLAVIDQYIDKSAFDVAAFASEMNLSSVQLRRKIKALTGQTITEFVRNHRLEMAAQLLQKGGLNVSEAAFRVGFDSLPYFSKVFQERFGKTPSEWK